MNKSNALGSLTVHASIVALVLLCGSVVHPVVENQRHAEHLVFALPAADLPVPIATPGSVKATQSALSAQPSAERLTVSSPSSLTANLEPEKPRLVAMSLPSSLDLPQASTPHVSVAPQVTVGAFGSTAGAVSGHQAGSVSGAGFGAAQGTGAAGRSGASFVRTAGFDLSPEVSRAVTTRIAQPPTQPVITYEPAAVYSEAARAARIQGAVDVRVKFRIDGSVQIVGIVNGLPGLNDSALAVVRGIRFVPGSSEVTTTVHVRFELAD